MNIIQWKVYCTVEEKYVTGFTEESNGLPTVCYDNNTHSINPVLTQKLQEIRDNYSGHVTKWKIFCDTEGEYTYGYSDSETYPERCFNNTDHVVSKKPIELKRLINNRKDVNIQEELHNLEPTTGRFRCDGFEITAAGGSVTRKVFCWPYPISALVLKFTTEEIHRNDYINCYGRPTTYLNNISSDISPGTSVLPVKSVIPFSVGMSILITDSVNTEHLGAVTSIGETTVTVQNPTSYGYYKNAYITYYNPVGIVASAVTSGDVVITCNSTVMQNVTKGMVLDIYDSVHMEKLGEVFEKDMETNTVTIQNSPEFNYTVGSYLSVSLHMIKNYKLGPPTEHVIGAGKIGASYVAKFHTLTIEYYNNSVDTQKNFCWNSEILY